MENKTQIEFQRNKNIERKEEVAKRIETSRAEGTYDLFTDNDMIITFSDHLREQHKALTSRSALSKFIATLQDQKKSGSIFIDDKTSIYDVISVTVYKFIISKMFTQTTRSDLVFGMNLLYCWENGAALYLVEEFTNLFSDKIEKESVVVEGKTEVQIFPTEEFAEELEQHEAILLESQKVFWPLAVKPKDWTQYRDTPFHDPLISYQIVRRKFNPTNFNLQGMFDVANGLASTSFKVNALVLDRAKQALRSRNMNIFKSKKYSAWEDRSAKRGSKSSALRKIKAALNAAEHFRDSEFWHVWCMDYRGRCYAVDRILDPQGSELEKALHIASEAVPVGESGIRELKIALITAMGDDKISLVERIAKAEKLLEDGTLGQWVLGTDNGWMDADEPFFALTYANELVKWKASGYDLNMKSGVFVAVDASCSGMQLAAGIQKDESLASLVNIDTSDSVGDLYSAVGRAVHDHYEGPLKDRILNRKIWKRPTMCTLYSLTFIGAWNYIKEELDKDTTINEWGHETVTETINGQKVTVERVTEEYKKELTALTNIFFNKAMPAVAPQAFEILAIMQGWAKDVCKSEEFKKTDTLKWTTPSGMIVNQRQMVMKKRRIKACLSNRTKVQHTIQEPTDKVDAKKHASCIAANMIHSMDAAVMWGVVLGMAKQNMPMLHCHDAFGTVPGHAAEMGRIIREVFLQVVLDNPLEAVKKELEGRYNITLRDLPAPGELDVKVILQSPHAFR